MRPAESEAGDEQGDVGRAGAGIPPVPTGWNLLPAAGQSPMQPKPVQAIPVSTYAMPAGYRPPRKERRWAMIAIGAAVVVLMAVGGVLVVRSMARAKIVVNKLPDRGLVSGAALQGHPDAVAIRKSLDEYVWNLQQGNFASAAECYDAERLLKELQSQGTFSVMNAADTKSFSRGMKRGFADQMALEPSLRTIKNVRVASIAPGGDVRELSMVIRAEVSPTPSKMRWWLRRQDDGVWKIYDAEEIGSGIRLTTAIGAAKGMAGNASLPNDMKSLRAAMERLGAQDWDGAEASLKSLQSASFPPRIESLRTLAQGLLLGGRHKHQEALAAYDNAEKLSGEMAYLNLGRARSFNALQRYAEAATAARKYLAVVGDEGEALAQLGVAEEGVGNLAAAADAFSRGLAEEPTAMGLVAGLARSLDVKRIGEMTKVMTQSQDPAGAFESAATEVDDNDRLQAIVAAYRPLAAANDPLLAYHDARAKVMAEQLEAALPLLLAHVGTKTDEHGLRLDRLYLTTAIAAKKYDEAYAKFPRKLEAFYSIASDRQEADDAVGLKRIIETHGKTAAGANDPWLAYYTGEMRLLEKEPAKAAESFKAALAKMGDAEERESPLERLVYARHSAGQAELAYREASEKDRSEVYGQLWRLMENKKDMGGAEKLWAMHQADIRNPSERVFEAARLAWLRKDYEAVAGPLRKSRSAILAWQEDRDWELDDMVIRSLGRLGRVPEARKYLLEIGATRAVTRPALLLAVWDGDVAAVTAILEKSRWLAYQLKADPDVKEIWAGAKFAVVRSKYETPEKSKN